MVYQSPSDDDKIGLMRRLAGRLGDMKKTADQRFGVLSRLVQFGGVGASGVIVDLGTLTLFLWAAVPMSVARILGIWLAMTWNFFGNRLITFRDSCHVHPLKQYWKFVVSCSVGAIINWGVSMELIYLIPEFYLQPQVCALGGIVAGLVSNFTFAHRWVFAPEEAMTGAEGGQSEDELRT